MGCTRVRLACDVNDMSLRDKSSVDPGSVRGKLWESRADLVGTPVNASDRFIGGFEMSPATVSARREDVAQDYSGFILLHFPQSVASRVECV